MMLEQLAEAVGPGAGASYRRAMWMPKDWVWTAKAQLVRNFLSRQMSGVCSMLSKQAAQAAQPMLVHKLTQLAVCLRMTC